jgi:hypothetical protein
MHHQLPGAALGAAVPCACYNVFWRTRLQMFMLRATQLLPHTRHTSLEKTAHAVLTGHARHIATFKVCLGVSIRTQCNAYCTVDWIAMQLCAVIQVTRRNSGDVTIRIQRCAGQSCSPGQQRDQSAEYEQGRGHNVHQPACLLCRSWLAPRWRSQRHSSGARPGTLSWSRRWSSMA